MTFDYTSNLSNLQDKALREQDIFVLEKGAIEEYYPDSVSTTNNSKVEKAQEYCRQVRHKSDVISKYSVIEGKLELELIFEQIFES